MKTSHPDMFQSLDFVRAYNITMVKNKQIVLKDHFLVSDYQQDNDAILFEIDSTNIWLRIKFQLFDCKQLTIEGYT